MPNLYSPVRHAFVQDSYRDQQGTALAGSLAFVADANLVDACMVGDVDDNGLEAGLAVVFVPASDVRRAGLNEEAVALPTDSATADHIAGVVVRSQQMNSNTKGRACHFAGEMCNVARVGRSGARIWVRLADGAQPEVGGAVHVVVSGEGVGRFASVAGSGNLAVPAMTFKSRAADGLALVELR